MDTLDCFLTQGGSSTKLMTANAVKRPTGMLMKNTHRQLKLSVIPPPTVGPSPGATTVAMAVREKARPRCAGGNVSRMIDCWFGCRPPPKNPCSTRKMISSNKLFEIPHKNEHAVNAKMQMTK